jgi:hypothetical protein
MGVSKGKFKLIRNVRRTGKVKAEIEPTIRKGEVNAEDLKVQLNESQIKCLN